MDGFTASYLAELTAALTERVLEAAGRRVQEAFAGTEGELPLHREHHAHRGYVAAKPCLPEEKRVYLPLVLQP